MVRPAAGEPSSVTAATSRPVSRPANAAGSATVADASTRRGPRAVARAHPQQPAQQQRHVRAEHPAVGVALVHHHELQPAQERRPLAVPRQQGAVQHVRVAEHPAGVLPGPVARVGRGVAVERCRAHIGEGERLERAQLVGRECLRRRQVEGGGPAVLREPREHGQLVGQRLPRRGTGGHHHVAARPGQFAPPRPGGSTAARTPWRPHASRSCGGAQCGHAAVRPARGGRRTACRSGPIASPRNTSPGRAPSSPSCSDPDPASTRRRRSSPRPGSACTDPLAARSQPSPTVPEVGTPHRHRRRLALESITGR